MAILAKLPALGRIYFTGRQRAWANSAGQILHALAVGYITQVKHSLHFTWAIPPQLTISVVWRWQAEPVSEPVMTNYLKLVKTSTWFSGFPGWIGISPHGESLHYWGCIWSFLSLCILSVFGFWFNIPSLLLLWLLCLLVLRDFLHIYIAHF